MTDSSGYAVGCDIGGTYCKIGLVEKYLNSHWFERSSRHITVKRTVFGSNAGTIGAASLIL